MFRDYCEPRKNEVFERYKFWQRDQREEETVDQWVNELRLLLSSCEYCEQKETNLRDRIVFGVADMRVKKRLLRESGITLDKELDICHAAEASKVQMKVMVTENQQSHDVNFLRKNKSVNRGKSYRQGSKPPECSTVTHKHHTQFHQGNNCGYCGSQHQPRKCPAYGVICSKCKGKNHFTKVCRGGKYTKKVYQVETEHVDNNDDSSNYFFVGTVTGRKHSTSTDQKWQAVINVQGNSVRFKLDTGSEANVLPIKCAQRNKVC